MEIVYPVKELNKIVRASGMSVYRDGRNGETVVRDSNQFKGMPLSKIEEATDLINTYNRVAYESRYGKTISYKEEAGETFSRAYNVLDSARKLKQLDSVKAEDIFRAMNNDAFPLQNGGISNNLLGIGTPGSVYSRSEVAPNIWISPWDANALYSQGGLAKVIIDKKSKSILSNGLKVKNSRLTSAQIDAVTEEAVRLGVPKLISDAARDSLVYGGSVVFPMFKKDTPATMTMGIDFLIKNGIIRKGCIERFITLDRWNAMVIPPINPVEKDYLNPSKYIIPFLGADVNGQRVSRVVVNAQSGWIGNALTIGWGNSDYLGYCRQIINYNLTMQSIPMMIQQMSILVRQIELDSTLAMEGVNVIDDLASSNTTNIRKATPDNPIQMDIIGNLKSIDRDFGDVPDLLRIVRQDLCAAAQIPEPLLFSTTRGAFSNNDDIQGNMNKQYEALSHYHKGIEIAFKPLAQLLILNTLGVTEEVLEALPYTQIHFDVPVITDPVDRAKVSDLVGSALFKTASAQIPINIATEMVSNLIGDDLTISSEVLDRLEEVQRTNEKRSEERHNNEMLALRNQIKNTTEGTTGGTTDKRKRRYSRMEQKQHEKVKLGDVHMNALTRAKNLSSGEKPIDIKREI